MQAVEYTHVSDVMERNWLKTVFESGLSTETATTGRDRLGKSLAPLSRERQREVLELLVRSDHLERFLGSVSVGSFFVRSLVVGHCSRFLIR